MPTRGSCLLRCSPCLGPARRPGRWGDPCVGGWPSLPPSVPPRHPRTIRPLSTLYVYYYTTVLFLYPTRLPGACAARAWTDLAPLSQPPYTWCVVFSPHPQRPAICALRAGVTRAEWAKNERSRACGGDAGWDETALDTQIHPSLCAAIRSAAPPGVHSTKTTYYCLSAAKGGGGSGSRGRGRQGEAVTGRQGGKEKG